MNPKLLEIWKEVKYEYKPTDYLVIALFGALSYIAGFTGNTGYSLMFGLIFGFQLIKLFAITFTTQTIVEDMNVATAKRIYFKLQKEPKEEDYD